MIGSIIKQFSTIQQQQLHRDHARPGRAGESERGNPAPSPTTRRANPPGRGRRWVAEQNNPPARPTSQNIQVKNTTPTRLTSGKNCKIKQNLNVHIKYTKCIQHKQTTLLLSQKYYRTPKPSINYGNKLRGRHIYTTPHSQNTLQ